jgi:Transcriptional regulators
MYTIADRLGISVSEVSRAFTKSYKMNADKRTLILRTASELGYVRNDSASRLSMRPLRIGIIYTESVPEFFGEIMYGLRTAEKMLSSYKLFCTYRCTDRDGFPCIDKIEDALREFTNEGYDGVIIASSSDGIVQCIGRYSNKIKIGLVNIDAPDSGRLFASVNDTFTVACTAAHLLSLYHNDTPAHTLVITGDSTHWTHRQILSVFLPEAEHLSLNVQGIYAAQNDNDLERQLDGIFNAHPNVTGIYLTSSISIPICSRIRSMGLSGKIRIVTSDIFKRLYEYLEDGTVLATLWQNPGEQARRAVECMYNYLANGIEPPQHLIARPEIVMKSNLPLYITENQ